MQSPGRWQPSTPWQRVGPVAAAVVAVHALLLHGWQLANGGLQPAVPAVSTMVVRLLTPTPPAPPPAPPAAPAVVTSVEPPPAPAEPATHAQRSATGRTVQIATASASPAASRPLVSPSRAAPPESEYLAASRLDPGPKLLDDVDPLYPPEAGLTEGSVVLRLLIGTTGTVDDVTVVRSAPKGLFERSAVAAFSAARFSPGRVLGVPVKSQVTIEVQFTPIDRGSNVAAPTY
jgi:protein TonB